MLPSRPPRPPKPPPKCVLRAPSHQDLGPSSLFQAFFFFFFLKSVSGGAVWTPLLNPPFDQFFHPAPFACDVTSPGFFVVPPTPPVDFPWQDIWLGGAFCPFRPSVFIRDQRPPDTICSVYPNTFLGLPPPSTRNFPLLAFLFHREPLLPPWLI